MPDLINHTQIPGTKSSDENAKFVRILHDAIDLLCNLLHNSLRVKCEELDRPEHPRSAQEGRTGECQGQKGRR